MLLNCGVGEDSWESLGLQGERPNQSILKETSPEYSSEGLLLKLKLQYFGHPMRRTDSLEKTLMLGKIEGRRRKGWQRMKWLDGVTDSMDEFAQALGVGDGREAWCAAVHGVEKSWTRLSDWTELRGSSKWAFYQPRNCFPVGPLLLPAQPKALTHQCPLVHTQGVNDRCMNMKEWISRGTSPLFTLQSQLCHPSSSFPNLPSPPLLVPSVL